MAQIIIIRHYYYLVKFASIVNNRESPGFLVVTVLAWSHGPELPVLLYSHDIISVFFFNIYIFFFAIVLLHTPVTAA